LALPPLPGVVRVLGEPAPGGSSESLRFSNDGRIVMASLYQGMSRAYEVTTGELVLDTSAYQAIDRLKANPRRARWTAIRFIFSTLAGFIGLGPGLSPRLTRRGKELLKQRPGPMGLDDFDLAARQVRKIEDEWPVLSPDGRVWASAEMDAPLAFIDAQTGGTISTSRKRTTAGDTGPRVFSRDAKLFSAERKTGLVGIWDVPSGKVRHELKGHTGDLAAVAFSPDGTLLASAGADGTIVLWNVETGEWLARQVGWEGGASSIEILSHRGTPLLAATDMATLGLFEIPSLEALTRIGGGAESLEISAIGGSPDGALLAAGRLDDTVHLLDIAVLLAAPGYIEGDTVRVATSPPPTEEDDRRNAEAFEEFVKARLAELDGALDGELRALLAALPRGTTRVAFNFDPLLLADGDSVSWEAFGRDGSLASGTPALFSMPLLPAESLSTPQYQSAKSPPEDALAKLFCAWMARRWQAVAPPDLKAVLVPPESLDEEFDLRKGRWKR